MKRKLCSLIIAAILLVPAFVFAAKLVPNRSIFSEDDWYYWYSYETVFEDKVGEGSIVISAVFYKRRDSGYYVKMGVWKIFGEDLFKTFQIRNSLTNIVLENQVQVEKDGELFTARVEHPKWEEVRDQNAKIIAFVIVLNDDNGKEIVRREVKRK